MCKDLTKACSGPGQHISSDSIAKSNCSKAGRSSGFRMYQSVQRSSRESVPVNADKRYSGYSSASAMDLHHLPFDQLQVIFLFLYYIFPPSFCLMLVREGIVDRKVIVVKKSMISRRSEGLPHASTQPGFYVLCTMAWSMHNRPLKAFDQGVIAREMIEAGFKSVRSRTLDTNWGPMDMDIARK